MNTKVPLQNSFRLAGRVNSELIGSLRNTERMIHKLFATTEPGETFPWPATAGIQRNEIFVVSLRSHILVKSTSSCFTSEISICKLTHLPEINSSLFFN